MMRFSTAQILSVVTDKFFAPVSEVTELVRYVTGPGAVTGGRIVLAKLMLVKQSNDFAVMAEAPVHEVNETNSQEYLKLFVRRFGESHGVMPGSNIQFTAEELSKLAQDMGVPRSQVLARGNALTFNWIAASIRH